MVGVRDASLTQCQVTTNRSQVTTLKFADKPDYSYLRKMFKDLFFREGYAYDHNFDWTLKNNGSTAQGGAPGGSATAPKPT